MMPARLLRYAALQFVVLVGLAMAFYQGGTWWDPTTSGYTFGRNFLSDLGMTRAYSGETNYVSCVMFTIALTSLGLGLVPFAWTWRRFAFTQGRAVAAGHASAVLGTLCGLAFAGIGVTPFDLALHAHNTLVLVGFGLLPVYIGALSFLLWRNGRRGALLASSIVYLVVVVGYAGLIFLGPSLATPHGHKLQVVGQKLIAGASIAHLLVLCTLARALDTRVVTIRSIS